MNINRNTMLSSLLFETVSQKSTSIALLRSERRRLTQIYKSSNKLLRNKKIFARISRRKPKYKNGNLWKKCSIIAAFLINLLLLIFIEHLTAPEPPERKHI